MFAAPQARTTMWAANRSVSPFRSTTTSVTAPPAWFGLELHGLGVRQQRDVRVLEGGPHPEHLRVRLSVHRAREAVAVLAADAGAVRHVALGQPDAARRVERVESGRGEIVGELLDPRLVRDGRERVRSACRRLGRILASGAVNLVEVLSLRVVRLQLVVGDRPGGRDAVVVAKLAEVLLAEPVERGAVELRRTTDEVVDLRLERRAGRVVPGVGGDVAVVDEDVLREPVLRLARQPVAALEQQDPLARGRQVAGERPASRPGADDDDVVVVHRSLSASDGALTRSRASCQPPWPLSSLSAAAGPHVPGAYGCTRRRRRRAAAA